MLLGTALIVILAALFGARHYATHLLAERDRDDTLAPINSLLAENKRLLTELDKEGLAQGGELRLTAFLSLIRKDGVPGQAANQRRIDTLVNNNTSITALLFRYSPRARTADFRMAAEKYREYAQTLRDRWQSVFATFMAGGNLAGSDPATPAELKVALEAESAQLP